MSLVLWVGWPPAYGRRRYYHWLCYPVALIGASGIWPGAPFYPLLQAGAEFPGATASYVALGLIGLIGGLLDHRLLTRSLHRLSKEDLYDPAL
jgi:hypothetical protein